MSSPDAWELLITRASRLVLERALEQLLHRDAALLRAALDKEPVSVPTVHLSRGELTMLSGRMPLTPRLPRCGALSSCVTDDPLAATCIQCKAPVPSPERLERVAEGRCWRMGCQNPVEDDKAGSAEHDLFDIQEES